MATRTIKLIGKAYSTSGDVSIAVDFNNKAVYNGTVTTVNGEAPKPALPGEELASWTIDTSVTGSIPMAITVTGGTFQFNDLIGNYVEYVDPSADPQVPDTTTFGMLNYNTESSDGKDNVTFSEVDGDGQQRVIVDSNQAEGDWVYSIQDGVTFSCNFIIDADLTVA